MVTAGDGGAIQIWETLTTPTPQSATRVVKATATPSVVAAATLQPTPTSTPLPTSTVRPTATATAHPTAKITARATATVTRTATVTQPKAIVQVSTLNVRTGPGTTYDIQGQVHQEDVLSVIGEARNCAWLYITTPDGITGWVSGATGYIQLEGECADLSLAITPDATPIPSPTFSATPTSLPITAPTSAATLPSASNVSATIFGKVFRSDTGELITGGEVSLSMPSAEGTESERISEVKTDDAGRYSFVDIAPGTYTLSIAVEYKNEKLLPCELGLMGLTATADGWLLGVGVRESDKTFFVIGASDGFAVESAEMLEKDIDISCHR